MGIYVLPDKFFAPCFSAVDNSSSLKHQVRVKALLGYSLTGDLSHSALRRAGNVQIYQVQLHIGVVFMSAAPACQRAG